MNRRTSLKAIAAMAASAGIQGQAPPPAIGATLKDPKTFPVHLFDAV